MFRMDRFVPSIRLRGQVLVSFRCGLDVPGKAKRLMIVVDIKRCITVMN